MPIFIASSPLAVGSNRVPTSTTFILQQVRHATLIKRPKRPYTFTQLITLSDGSAFVHRTTSPAPVHRSNKDVRNSIMWNPTSRKLLNMEQDEAGRLRAFRARFGRGWDADTSPQEESFSGESGAEAKRSEGNLMDLISGFGQSGASTSSTGLDKLESASENPKKKNEKK